jgi:hypothetical protein
MSAVLQPQGSSSTPASGTPGSLAAAASTAFKDAAEPSAAERLAASRARLRGAMMDIAHPPAPEYTRAGNLGESIRNLFLRVKTLPGAALVVDSLDSWWRQHPLRTAGMVAGEASRTLVSPMARRSPGTLLLGATAVGALFMLTKPWRWLLRPALFVGLVPQIATHALRRMPIETWLQMMSSLTARRGGTTAARQRTTSPTPAAAGTTSARTSTTPGASVPPSSRTAASATTATALP